MNKYGKPRSHRADANQTAIVAGLRGVGASVFSIGSPVDLLVGYRGNTVLLEVKDGKKRPSERKLRATQFEFFLTWRGGKALKVESLDDALKAIGAT